MRVSGRKCAVLQLLLLVIVAVSCENTAVFDPSSLSWRNVSELPGSLGNSTLTPSDDLWTGQAEPITLAWEAIGTLHMSDGTNPRVGACNFENIDTGVPIAASFRGTLNSLLPPNLQVALTVCDPVLLSSGASLDTACRPVTPPCPAPGSANFPFCATNCVVAPIAD